MSEKLFTLEKHPMTSLLLTTRTKCGDEGLKKECCDQSACNAWKQTTTIELI